MNIYPFNSQTGNPTKWFYIYIVVLVIIIFFIFKPFSLIFTSVSIKSSYSSVDRGQNIQLDVKVRGIGNNDHSVVWMISGNSEGTTIDENGLLTISQNETSRSLIITAISQFDQTKSRSVTINVKEPTISNILIEGSHTLERGQTHKLNAEVIGTGYPEQSVSWIVIGGVSGTIIDPNTGELTIAGNENSETLTVKATSTINTNVSQSVIITVTGSFIWDVNDENTWNDAIAGIKNSGNNKEHQINVTANISVSGSNIITFGARRGITITLSGVGSNRTISLGSIGSMFTISSGVTLILDRNITLQGRNNNNAPLICTAHAELAVFQTS